MDFAIHLNTRLICTLNNILGVQHSEIYTAAGINSSTWYRIMAQPEIITIQQLLAIANSQHIPVSRFFYAGSAFLLGRREEYVTEPYEDCYYNADVLAEFVAASPTANWKDAARKTGVTRDNLRNSLLGTSRTPTTRFLEVCNIFGTDPFKILIDPNPAFDPKTARRSVPTPYNYEIKALRKDVSTLSQTVKELLQKYNELQQQFDDLRRQTKRFGAYPIPDDQTHMAADPIPDPTPDDD